LLRHSAGGRIVVTRLSPLIPKWQRLEKEVSCNGKP
jgi:hypothetical protein